MENTKEKRKYPARKKRDGWAYYTIYCPREGVEAIREFYKEWRLQNIRLWAEKGGRI